uniref:HTH CENPB-type domain-containing protein n=1 Tax=Sphaeramia orbicularis TaxID=375764 RepID=A0A673CZT8_9TELE
MLTKRKAITMETKLDIIKRSEKGETPTNIGTALGFSRSTVATIIKDKARILDHVKGSAPMKATVITKQRSSILIEMEKLLMLWIEDQNQRRLSISLMLIQEKARCIFQTLKEQKGKDAEKEEFTASKGWFMRFKARANLHNLKVQGEAASADEMAAKAFPGDLAKIIQEGGYLAEQVFNVDETGLFWKRLPSRTDISKEEKTALGHKVGKERLTLLLGGNAAGDFKLKPLLVYLAENPRALKGIWKSILPVIWKSNRKAWVTLAIFEDWFTYHFVPAVERYCAVKGIPFKVLLLLDNVVYLPPNTTSLLQPMDQGVIASFKAYYLRRTMAQALDRTENQENFNLKDFWRGYNIRDAIKNIANAWNEVKQTNMNGVWKKLCPQFVNDFHGFEETCESLETDDITELLDSHGEELSSEDLIELEKQMIKEDESIETPEPRHFTTKGLAEAFSLLEQAMARFEAEDPNMERFLKASRGVMDSVQCYREIWEEKRKISFQTDISKYFTKVERPVEPVPSTSTEYPAPATPPDNPDSPAAALTASPPSSPATSQQ